MNDLEPLSNDLSDLLAVERDIEDLAVPARSRMLERLERALPLAPVAPPKETPKGDAPQDNLPNGPANTPRGGTGGAAAAGTLGDALRNKLLVPVLSLLVGGAIGAGAHAAFTSSPVASRQAPSAVVLKLVVPTSSSEVAPPVAPPVVDSAGVLIDLSTATPVAPSASSNERGKGGTQLNAELLLLDAARTALTRGDYESALAALRKDARENPHGQLAEEREVMMVQALTASGDAAAAKQRAADFKRQFPDSLNRDTVNQLTPPKTP